MGQSSMMETEKITGLAEGPGRIGAWMLGRCGLREWREADQESLLCTSARCWTSPPTLRGTGLRAGQGPNVSWIQPRCED